MRISANGDNEESVIFCWCKEYLAGQSTWLMDSAGRIDGVVLIFAEKSLPAGHQFSLVDAVVLVA